MPCIEVTMPETDAKTKELLSTKLTDAFAEASGIPAEIFGIRYNEFAAGTTASGGKIWNGGDERPYLHMILYSPRLNRATKQKLVASLTQAFVEGIGNPEWKPVIHLAEHPFDNVGVDGQLLSDAFEGCANRKFYYDLQDE